MPTYFYPFTQRDFTGEYIDPLIFPEVYMITDEEPLQATSIPPLHTLITAEDVSQFLRFPTSFISAKLPTDISLDSLTNSPWTALILSGAFEFSAIFPNSETFDINFDGITPWSSGSDSILPLDLKVEIEDIGGFTIWYIKTLLEELGVSEEGQWPKERGWCHMTYTVPPEGIFVTHEMCCTDQR